MFDLEFTMLHQQREVDILRAGVSVLQSEMGEVTRMLRLLVKDSVQVCDTAILVCFACDVSQLNGVVC